MYQPIRLYLDATLRELNGIQAVNLKRVLEPVKTGYTHVSTIQVVRPDMEIAIYWRNLPLKKVRVINEYRSDIESFVKAIIAADERLMFLVESQTGGEDWHL